MEQEVAPGSYQVETDSDVMLRRNRRDLRLNRSKCPVRIDLETIADAVGETSEQVRDRNEGQPRQECVLNEQSVTRSSNRDRKPPSRFIQEL